MSRRMIPLHALTFSFAAVCGLACPAPSEDECQVGTEGCACTPGGSCDPGLACASHTCVDLESGSEGDAEPGDTSADDDDATSSDDGAPESSSGGVDECIESGGTRLESGYCYKQCTHDEDAPGEDLFEDCAALSMVCRDESTWGGQDFCFPANATCTTDADCDTGLACVHTTSDFGDDYCEVPCDAGGGCPETMRCVTSCQGGYFIDLDFCAGPFGWPAANPEPSVCG
jgi:hypothetical protein